MDEAELVDEVEEQEGEKQCPSNLLHALLYEPQIVKAAKPMSFIPEGIHSILHILLHLM